ncbi:MAG: hypothetical protein ACC618_01595, partial [Patescibacteria group bacterium]
MVNDTDPKKPPIAPTLSPPPPPQTGPVLPKDIEVKDKATEPNVAPQNVAPTEEFKVEPQTVEAKEKKSLFPVLLGFLILLAIGSFVFAGYFYFSNQKFKEETGVKDSVVTEVIQASPTSTPSFNPKDIEIVNGSIYNTRGAGNEILINKEDYPGTGIAGFTTVTVSPDSSKICFEALPPALEPALYFSNLESINVKKIAERVKNCTWSNASDMVAYLADTAADDPADIFKYDLIVDETTNLTKVSTESAVFRRYE